MERYRVQESRLPRQNEMWAVLVREEPDLYSPTDHKKVVPGQLRCVQGRPGACFLLLRHDASIP